jgi:hypothetical protein
METAPARSAPRRWTSLTSSSSPANVDTRYCPSRQTCPCLCNNQHRVFLTVLSVYATPHRFVSGAGTTSLIWLRRRTQRGAALLAAHAMTRTGLSRWLQPLVTGMHILNSQSTRFCAPECGHFLIVDWRTALLD